MTNSKKEGTRVDFLLAFFQNNKFTSVIIVLCLALIGLGKVTESGDQLLRSLGWNKPYDVNQVTERGRFSWELIETAWNRLFWMRNYTERIRRKAPAADTELSWQKLMLASEKWNTEVMNYYIGLDTFYPDSHKRDTLENHIQPSINSTMKLIVELRYSLKSDSVDLKNKIKEIQDSIEVVNNRLYHLVDQSLPKKKLLK